MKGTLREAAWFLLLFHLVSRCLQLHQNVLVIKYCFQDQFVNKCWICFNVFINYSNITENQQWIMCVCVLYFFFFLTFFPYQLMSQNRSLQQEASRNWPCQAGSSAIVFCFSQDRSSTIQKYAVTGEKQNNKKEQNQLPHTHFPQLCHCCLRGSELPGLKSSNPGNK